jgi:predicted helicase
MCKESPAMPIAATHRAIRHYATTIAEIRAQRVTKEGGLRRAFEQVLADLGRERGWTLLAEQTLASGKRPDAVLRDANGLPRGYWEAKDPGDDLEAEIKKKLRINYPTTNIIFEDSLHAVLFQNGTRTPRAFDLAQPQDLADLLESFFAWSEPAYEAFTVAVANFKERIPELAAGLRAKIAEQRQQRNATFTAAFEHFWQVCQKAIDPGISAAVIDEMLIQHLLTERLFRTVFDNPDFTRRNVIANEIETVIAALTHNSFNRADFLRGLDSFYVAIENSARTITTYAEKQDFLNTVYERFFQGFAVKEADTHGIVYTPQPIVSFMCASVEAVLQREFGRSLSDRGVQILDPATGTGNFIVNLLDRIAAPDLAYKYQHDLFCNEIMLLPYYIASMNIEHKYYERTGTYIPFEGLCFVDTLATAGQTGAHVQGSFMTEQNTLRVERELDAQIMVIIGNPPYNVGQENENDNNKNRKYRKAKKTDPDQIDDRIQATYAKDSKATLKTQLYDAYVKFFRWATDRLGDRDGIVCYVSNNSFIDQIAFDGMRHHLLQDFTQIWHLDLHGNVRKNPKLSGTTHNVFGIQVGVGITIAIRKRENPATGLWYYRVPEDWRKEDKLSYLAQHGDITHIKWQEPEPDEQYNWLTEGMRPEFATFLPIGSKTAKAAKSMDVQTIFKTYCPGINSSRDSVVYNFDRESLADQIAKFTEDYNGEVFRWIRAGKPKDVDGFLRYNTIKWSESLKLSLKREQYGKYNEQSIRIALYRPFCRTLIYYDQLIIDRPGAFSSFFPSIESEQSNTTIIVSDHGYRSPFSTMISNTITDMHLCASTDAFQCFPFYTYDPDGTNRQENITDWALAQFQAAYGPGVTKRDIFHYIYAILHHPAYRARYAENLKRELPRIPLVGLVAPANESAPMGHAATKATSVAWDVSQPAKAGFVAESPIGAGSPAGSPGATTPFRALVAAGAALARLHIGYETAAEHPLHRHIDPAVPFTWRVQKMSLSRDKTALQVNDALRLEGIPPEALNYRLGNRSALEWVIDQYQITTDKRSGITSDPNRRDDPEYIVRLVGQVITVSLATNTIIAGLSDLGLPTE